MLLALNVPVLINANFMFTVTPANFVFNKPVTKSKVSVPIQ